MILQITTFVHKYSRVAYFTVCNNFSICYTLFRVYFRNICMYHSLKNYRIMPFIKKLLNIYTRCRERERKTEICSRDLYNIREKRGYFSRIILMNRSE